MSLLSCWDEVSPGQQTSVRGALCGEHTAIAAPRLHRGTVFKHTRAFNAKPGPRSRFRRGLKRLSNSRTPEQRSRAAPQPTLTVTKSWQPAVGFAVSPLSRVRLRCPRAPLSRDLLEGWQAGGRRPGKPALSTAAGVTVPSQAALPAPRCVTRLKAGTHEFHFGGLLSRPGDKGMFCGFFMKFVCFIKAPIVPSLRRDYAAGVVPSAWVKETAALPCRRKFGTAGPGRETGEVRGRPSIQRAQRPGLLGLGPTGSCDQHRLRSARLQRDLPCLSPRAGPISWAAPLVPWPLPLM